MHKHILGICVDCFTSGAVIGGVVAFAVTYWASAKAYLVKAKQSVLGK